MSWQHTSGANPLHGTDQASQRPGPTADGGARRPTGQPFVFSNTGAAGAPTSSAAGPFGIGLGTGSSMNMNTGSMGAGAGGPGMSMGMNMSQMADGFAAQSLPTAGVPSAASSSSSAFGSFQAGQPMGMGMSGMSMGGVTPGLGLDAGVGFGMGPQHGLGMGSPFGGPFAAPMRSPHDGASTASPTSNLQDIMAQRPTLGGLPLCAQINSNDPQEILQALEREATTLKELKFLYSRERVRLRREQALFKWILKLQEEREAAAARGEAEGASGKDAGRTKEDTGQTKAGEDTAPLSDDELCQTLMSALGDAGMETDIDPDVGSSDTDGESTAKGRR